MKRLSGLLALVLSCIPRLALASASPPEPIPLGLPGVEVEGVAQAQILELAVRCELATVIETAARCDVAAAVELVAIEPSTISPQRETTPGEIRVDGVALEAPLALAQGQRALVAIHFEVALSTETRSSTQYWSICPIQSRHFFLGESSELRREGDGAFGELVRGAHVTLSGATHVVATTAGLDVAFGGARIDGESQPSPAHAGIGITLVVEERDPPLLQHGGPVLSLGARFSLRREDDLRFLLRVAYEIGLADYVVVSVSFESDFQSILESAVIEVATPELLILLPGIAGGIGVVARQLGNRDADAALRLRFGANILAAGVTADFDYWPTIGEWTASVVGRLSF